MADDPLILAAGGLNWWGQLLNFVELIQDVLELCVAVVADL